MKHAAYYSTNKKNPILECLADQTRCDLEWMKYQFTSETLLAAILNSLETKRLMLQAGNFISSGDWIKNMRKDPFWYLRNVFNKSGYSKFDFVIMAENLLIGMISDYLKRPIKLIPLVQGEFTIFGESHSNQKPYILGSYQNGGSQNFFCSVF